MSNRAELRLLLGGVVIGVALSYASWWGVLRYLRGLLEQSEGRHHGERLAAQVVKGHPANVKITTPRDLTAARSAVR